MKTAQEIFDAVIRHLRKQGRRANDYSPIYSRYVCRYRGDNGTKCAVGCLIDDEHYNPACEGVSVGGGNAPARVALHEALRASGVDAVEHASLLSSLQNFHDVGWSGSEITDNQVSVLASYHGLVGPIP